MNSTFNQADKYLKNKKNQIKIKKDHPSSGINSGELFL